jgi:hypothetical protein
VFVNPTDEVTEGFVTIGIVVVESEFEHLAFEDSEGRGGEIGFAGRGGVDELGAGGGRFFRGVETSFHLKALFESVKIGLRNFDVGGLFEQFAGPGESCSGEEPIGQLKALVFGESIDSREWAVNLHKLRVMS